MQRDTLEDDALEAGLWRGLVVQLVAEGETVPTALEMASRLLGTMRDAGGIARDSSDADESNEQPSRS